MVLQTIAVPVLETPVAPATVQIALGVTIGLAVVVVFVGVGVVVLVEGLGVVGAVEVFTGSVTLVVGALVGSTALVVGAFVGSVFGAAGSVAAGVLLGSASLGLATGAGWLGSVIFVVTRTVDRISDDAVDGRCLSGSALVTSGAAIAPTATSDRRPPPTTPSFITRLNDFHRPSRRRASDGPDGIRYGGDGFPLTFDMRLSSAAPTDDVCSRLPHGCGLVSR